jgi:PAS domain S-box-containing protein
MSEAIPKTFAPPKGFPFRLFLVLFLPVMALILGGGWYIGQDRINEQLGLLGMNEINHVVRGVRTLDDGLHDPLLQVRSLAGNDDVRRALERGESPALATAFATLMAYNPAYDKLRWVDAAGRERVRVDNRDRGVEIAPPERLQDVAGRYYIASAAALKPGEVYVSPLDLTFEQGKVATPYRPALRLVTPALDAQGRSHGFLVANIAAQPLLDAFATSLLEARDYGMLLNSEGYWLHGGNAEENWGFMFGRQDTLASRNPTVWRAMGEMESGQVQQADGLWTWSTVYPLKAAPGQAVDSLPFWRVVTHVPAAQLALARAEAWKPVQAYTLLLLLGFGTLSLWLAYAIVGRTRAKMEAAQAHAEAEHALQLSEAQERFRLVVQANTNGLLVVDSRGRIVLTNPALERMFGHGPDELLGQPLEVLLPAGKRAAHGHDFKAYMAAPGARPMGAGRELTGVRKDGSEFPVEISLSPFMEKGEMFVDAFVADISARKQSERLHALSEARLHHLVENNPDGLLLASEAGAVEMANPALERLLGYGHGALYNLPLERLLPKALNPELARWQLGEADILGDNGPWPRLVWLHRDGSQLFLATHLIRFQEQGRALAMLTVDARQPQVQEPEAAVA